MSERELRTALEDASEVMDDAREIIRLQHLDGPQLADQRAALEAVADTLYDAAVEARSLLEPQAVAKGAG